MTSLESALPSDPPLGRYGASRQAAPPRTHTTRMSAGASSQEGRSSSGEAILGGVLAEARHLHPDDLGALLRRWGARAGLEDTVVYVADRDQAQLTAVADPAAAPEPVEGSVAGRCYQRGEPVEVATDEERHAWFPLTDGSTRVGVMRARLDPFDRSALARATDLASLAAYLIVAKTPLSDQLTGLLNARPLTLAAEMRWAALPRWRSRRNGSPSEPCSSLHTRSPVTPSTTPSTATP